jgi:hypothetical protein
VTRNTILILRATNRLRRKSEIYFALLLFVFSGGWILMASSGEPLAQASDSYSQSKRCRMIRDDVERERCYADSIPNSSDVRPQQQGVQNRWHLVRTRNPAGGGDMVAIMRTANVSRSDIDFAGLMFRCGDVGPEMLIVLVRPLPIRSHPKVVIDGANGRVPFIANVLSPGLLVLLPPEATGFAAGLGQTQPYIKIAVDNRDEKVSINGVVALDGLAAATIELQANCSAK